MAASHSAFIGAIHHYCDQYLGPLIFEEHAADLAQRVVAPRGGRAGARLAERAGIRNCYLYEWAQAMGEQAKFAELQRLIVLSNILTTLLLRTSAACSVPIGPAEPSLL